MKKEEEEYVRFTVASERQIRRATNNYKDDGQPGPTGFKVVDLELLTAMEGDRRRSS